jgi:hypothetical protein
VGALQVCFDRLPHGALPASCLHTPAVILESALSGLFREF